MILVWMQICNISKNYMGKKKDKQKLIQQARAQRKMDKQTKMKMRKKMAKGDSFKLTEQYMKYYKDFDIEISKLRIRLKDVVGDGNCLFRSFADQIDGNQTTHVIMRQQACKYMELHSQFFQPFLDEQEDGTFQNYIKFMKKSGQWGGHLQLQALSQCFRCIIVVHKRGLEQFNIRPIYEIPQCIVHLGYFQHQDFEHYVSIRQINDTSQFSALRQLDRLNKTMYNFLLHDDPEEFLLRQQLQELQLNEKIQEINYEEVQEVEPFPNYPRNKKCKCGSKIDYKSCCFKQWQKRLEKKWNK